MSQMMVTTLGLVFVSVVLLTFAVDRLFTRRSVAGRRLSALANPQNPTTVLTAPGGSLTDALDLLVLCLEAGSSLDQAIVKASDELGVAYPALGDQLRILIAEMRAGKPRLEAFRGLATRTQVDDVRSLVSMLVQTDKFG